MATIRIAEDFTRFPGGRYRRHGGGSGEEFREKFLVPALQAEDQVTVDFSGAAGYPASFLEEAFGGLVREGVDAAQLKKLKLVSRDPSFLAYTKTAWEYIEAAMADADKPSHR